MMTAPRDPRAELLRCGDVEANPGPGPSVVPPGLQELGGRRGPPSRSGRRSVSQGPTVEEQVRPRDTQGNPTLHVPYEVVDIMLKLPFLLPLETAGCINVTENN